MKVVHVWLEENGITFPKRFFRNLNGKLRDPITEEHIPTNEELKRIVEYMPIHGKALTLTLASSGMRIGETLQLTDVDIDFDHEPVKITIPARYTKIGKRRITFISPEAKEALVEWLSYREQYVQQANGRSAIHKRLQKDPRTIFPFSQSNFNEIWKNALTKANLLVIDKRTRRMVTRPHNLRKYFRLRIGQYGRDEAEALMGHQQGLNAIYARFEGEYGDKRLREVYISALPQLSIYRSHVDAKKVQELENNVTTLQTNVVKRLGVIEFLQRNGKEKDAKIHELTREVDQLKQHVTTLNEFAQQMQNLKIDIELRKKEELVKYVLANAPNDDALRRFMERRRIERQLLKDTDLQCVSKEGDRWLYHSDLDTHNYGIEG